MAVSSFDSTMMANNTRIKIGINDYATMTKTVHNDSKTTENESLWTVLVVVA
jgi:hypothetical protein